MIGVAHPNEYLDAAFQQADDSLDRALERVITEQRNERRQPVRSRVNRLRWGTVLAVFASVGMTAVGFAVSRMVATTALTTAVGFSMGVGVGILVSVLPRVAGRLRWREFEGAIKRAADVAISVVALVLLAPVMLSSGIALLAEARRGPVFVREVRMGQHGRPFMLHRFRTSHPSQPAVQTAFGAFLRGTGLDELPELLNVIWGDLSLIGPRPRRPGDFMMGITHVLTMRPGIVSLADVRRVTSLELAETLDRLYERKWSLALDLRILLQTVLVAVGVKPMTGRTKERSRDSHH